MKQMLAALYSLRIKRPGPTEGFSDKEFISCGRTEDDISMAAENVRQQYETTTGVASLVGPFPLASVMFGEMDMFPIDWEEMKRLVDDKKKRIPKGEGGCIFRGNYLSSDYKSPVGAEKDDLKESIVYFMQEHRQAYYGEEYLFIGAIYDEKERRIAGGAVLLPSA